MHSGGPPDRHGDRFRQSPGGACSEETIGRDRDPEEGTGCSRLRRGGHRRQGILKVRDAEDNEHQQELLILFRIQRHSEARTCGLSCSDEVQGLRCSRRSTVLRQDDRPIGGGRCHLQADTGIQGHRDRSLLQADPHSEG